MKYQRRFIVACLSSSYAVFFVFHHILRWLCYTIYREQLRHFSDEINVVYTDTQTFVLTYTHTVDTHIVSGPCTCYHFYISSVYVENVSHETCVASLGWKADYTLVSLLGGVDQLFGVAQHGTIITLYVFSRRTNCGELF